MRSSQFMNVSIAPRGCSLSAMNQSMKAKVIETIYVHFPSGLFFTYIPRAVAIYSLSYINLHGHLIFSSGSF